MSVSRQARVGRPRRAGALLAASALVLAGLAGEARAAEVVLLVANRLERADIWEYPGPHLERLRAESAAGLMSTRFLLSSLPESAHVALGAGSYVQYEGSRRWSGGSDAATGWRVGRAGDGAAFLRATGRPLPPGALYCRESERVRLYSNPGAQPGALGAALHTPGKRTACIGNADLPGEPHREILSVLMDEQGVVDLGDVGAGTLVPDARAPGGVRTDPAAVARAFDRVARRADVVAIEFGDTSRLAVLREQLSPGAYARAREAALAQLDALVGLLRARVDLGRTLLVLLSPAPPVAPSATEQVLTPVLATGPGLVPGLLRSATTHQPGVVANGDIPATVAARLGIGPLPEGAGQPLGALPCPDARERLRRLDEDSRRVAQWRFSVFVLWAAVVGPALAIGPLLLLLCLRRGRLDRRARAAARGLQLAALALPAASLLVAGLAPGSLGPYVAALAAGVAAVVAGASLLARIVRHDNEQKPSCQAWGGLPAPLWIAGFTAAGLLADTALGSPRQWRMMVSYALTEGARYYGLGNELMGALVGLCLVGLMCALPRLGPRAPVAAGALGIGLGVAIGAPGLGANLGGALTAAVALVAAAMLQRGERGAWLVAAPAAAAGGVALALIALEMLHGPGGMSHIGRAVGSTETGGMEWVAAVVARKARMNAVLIGRSSLSGLFFAALPALLAAGARPPDLVRRAHPGVRPLLVSGVVGGLAAFLLNDSGVVAGGILLAFVAIGAGYLLLDRPEGEGDCASWR